jgi:dihydrofolate reductase
MIISLIVAMDERGGIGLNNRVPWHIPADLKRFKALTMGHHLVVGRKTYESIGRALPGRTMIIITRSVDYRAEGCLVVSSLPGALRLAKERGETEAFIGGGGSIYAQALPQADRIYLTRVHTEVEADVFFPQWDEKDWRILHQEVLGEAEGGGLASSFMVYERVTTDGSGLSNHPGA